MVALLSVKGVGTKAEYANSIYVAHSQTDDHIIHFMSKLTYLCACCIVSASEGVGLGHPIEYICLDLEAPNVCKYCGLRYVQVHHH